MALVCSQSWMEMDKNPTITNPYRIFKCLSIELLLFVYNKTGLISNMKIKNLNMYQRLRDFQVPAAVLDEIFANNDDLETLSQSWQALGKEGLCEDEVAESIAKVILDELGDDFIQSLSVLDEK